MEYDKNLQKKQQKNSNFNILVTNIIIYDIKRDTSSSSLTKMPNEEKHNNCIVQ